MSQENNLQRNLDIEKISALASGLLVANEMSQESYYAPSFEGKLRIKPEDQGLAASEAANNSCWISLSEAELIKSALENDKFVDIVKLLAQARSLDTDLTVPLTEPALIC